MWNGTTTSQNRWAVYYKGKRSSILRSSNSTPRSVLEWNEKPCPQEHPLQLHSLLPQMGNIPKVRQLDQINNVWLIHPTDRSESKGRNHKYMQQHGWFSKTSSTRFATERTWWWISFIGIWEQERLIPSEKMQNAFAQDRRIWFGNGPREDFGHWNVLYPIWGDGCLGTNYCQDHRQNIHEVHTSRCDTFPSTELGRVGHPNMSPGKRVLKFACVTHILNILYVFIVTLL